MPTFNWFFFLLIFFLLKNFKTEKKHQENQHLECLPMKCPTCTKDIVKICQRYFKDMHNIFEGHVKDIPKICQGY